MMSSIKVHQSEYCYQFHDSWCQKFHVVLKRFRYPQQRLYCTTSRGFVCENTFMTSSSTFFNELEKCNSSDYVSFRTLHFARLGFYVQ